MFKIRAQNNNLIPTRDCRKKIYIIAICMTHCNDDKLCSHNMEIGDLHFFSSYESYTGSKLKEKTGLEDR
jgi:hypothetical protein